jgi:hypothetical protein
MPCKRRRFGLYEDCELRRAARWDAQQGDGRAHLVITHNASLLTHNASLFKTLRCSQREQPCAQAAQPSVHKLNGQLCLRPGRVSSKVARAIERYKQLVLLGTSVPQTLPHAVGHSWMGNPALRSRDPGRVLQAENRRLPMFFERVPGVDDEHAAFRERVVVERRVIGADHDAVRRRANRVGHINR